jgi:pyridoxal phosphate enzyme (YggS family)
MPGMSLDTSSIAGNVERIRERIARAAARAGRRPEEITLIAVSKTFPAEAIREAYAAGVRHFGENRVQEWEGKQPHLSDLDATWHLVGHLQSNKARRAARLFHCVDSLDRLELAQNLDRAVEEPENLTAEGADAKRTRRTKRGRVAVLLEVRLAPEETKSGVTEADLPALAEAVLALPHLDLRGLMCIPPFFEDAEKVRPYFRRLRELRDGLRARLGAGPAPLTQQGSPTLQELSMGMSHDFEVAIKEGATQVRLGTALFGVRH